MTTGALLIVLGAGLGGLLLFYGQQTFRRGLEARSAPSLRPTVEAGPILTAEQEALLRALDKYQVQLAARKLVVARNGALLAVTSTDETKPTGVNLVHEVLSEAPPADEQVHFRFVQLMESLPEEYVRFYAETRYGNPFIVSVTQAGRRYLRR